MRFVLVALLLAAALASFNEPLQPRMAEVHEGATIQVHREPQGNLRAEIVDDLKSYDDIAFAKKIANKAPMIESQALPCLEECRAERTEYGLKADIVDAFPSTGSQMRFRSLTMMPALILLEMTNAQITTAEL
jgi:hypothetical protein